MDAHLTTPVRRFDLLAAIRTLAARPQQPEHKRTLVTRHSLRESGQLTVLLTEDHPVNRKLASRLLEKQGHRTATARNGREAVEMFAQSRFDLVLMDLQMPEMCGLEATAAIRALERSAGGGQHVPIIATTAHASNTDRERCLAAGMDGYLPKPLNSQRLFGLMQSLHVRDGGLTAAGATR